ncbi:actin depolymerizing protein [Auriculariales sp. MPI-PUGE-AT-0066]|nr:actin depolymerizing protein [Auriculariales sp. MPI-PUGE-AT-0066]
MASGQHLSHLEEHKIEGSNIELFGSEIEKRVREHAGDTEPAWETAGAQPGIEVWRIENFKVVTWPKERYGTFYSGDSYIVLYTYKPDPDSEKLAFNLHFWLGDSTTQDEMGTAAYKTVELDDHLHGTPVQYREVEGNESPQFLSYFANFTTLKGGVATGFHHVIDPLPLDLFKLYHIVSPEGAPANYVIVREVNPKSSLSYGDVYCLDKGTAIFQFNMQGSSGKERFKAAEFARSLSNSRGGSKCPITVSEQGASGAGAFLAALDISFEALPTAPPPARPAPRLFRISDANSDSPKFEEVPAKGSSLDSNDTFILHAFKPPAVFVWIGSQASSAEKKTAIKYGQRFLAQEPGQEKTSVVRLADGQETKAFRDALAA